MCSEANTPRVSYSAHIFHRVSYPIRSDYLWGRLHLYQTSTECYRSHNEMTWSEYLWTHLYRALCLAFLILERKLQFHGILWNTPEIRLIYQELLLDNADLKITEMCTENFRNVTKVVKRTFREVIDFFMDFCHKTHTTLPWLIEFEKCNL